MKQRQRPPYIRYCEVLKNQNLSYEKLYEKHLADTIKYFNEWGKDGFLSEKVYIDNITIIAERNAKNEFAQNECTHQIESIFVNKDDEQEIIKLTENRKDFVKWVGKYES